MEKVRAELIARKSWAGAVPMVREVRRKGGTLVIGIGTPTPASSTRWRDWWTHAACLVPDLQDLMLAGGGLLVYAGPESSEARGLFMTRSDCHRVDPNSALPQGGYEIAASAPSATSAESKRRMALTTQRIASPLPIALTVPADFTNATKLVYGEMAAPDTALYCDNVDAQLMRDQLLGKRADERARKGCLAVLRDASTYDPRTKRFSVESDIDRLNKQNIPGREPEIRHHALMTREVRGYPVLTFVQDSATQLGRRRVYFMYVAVGPDMWVVMLDSGRQQAVSTAIWDAVVNGLQ